VKIGITSPTGNIGSKLVPLLLETPGIEVTVLARNPKKVEQLASRGVRIVAGDQLNPASVDEAVKGADALFWLSGVATDVANVRAAYNEFADACAGALKRHPGLRVVHLSSIGAQLPEGTGPILGLHDGENKVNAAGANVVHVRANYFMENVLASLPTILSESAIYSAIPGSAVIEQVATADIAAAAAHYLLRGPSGHYVVDVLGPEKITYDEIAAVVGQVLGKHVKHVQIPPDALKQALLSAGLSEDYAREMVLLDEAIASGRLNACVGDAVWRGKIAFAEFVRKVVAPAASAAA
jgi:uncharacterized protein YbjT (DUF2867 family)